MEGLVGGSATIPRNEHAPYQRSDGRSAPETVDGDRHGTVICAKCGLPKPPTLFGRRLAGRQPWCNDRHRAYQRTWRRTDRGRALLRAANQRTFGRHPERKRARSLLRYAVLAGKLTRGACYAAGPECAGQIEGHHHDYARPLDVTWTCRAHHRALDRERRAS